MLGSLFNKIAGLSCNTCVDSFLKKETSIQVFPVDNGEFFISCFFTEQLQWLLPKILPWYSKVSWGVCSLLFDFSLWSKSYTKHCTNNYLLLRDKTISALLELIGHACALNFRMFLKNNQIDAKLTQSVAQITM